jgi:hypothetical protein
LSKVKGALIEEEEAVSRADLLRGTGNEEQIDHDLAIISDALGCYCEDCISGNPEAQQVIKAAFQNIREELTK